MPNCTTSFTEFPRLGRRVVEACFDGGDITTDAGVLLLSQAERRLNLLSPIAAHWPEWRCPDRIVHGIEAMLRQRVFGLALGYEDLNDHNVLRRDSAMQTAQCLDRPLASAPTLSRFESRADRAIIWRIHEMMVNTFIRCYPSPPAEIVLDVDATDDRVHGQQEGRFFHGYYGHYCFLPLYVFCGGHLLVSYLRPANIDGARHAGAILRLLIRRLREVWPNTRFIIRGDGGFCRRPLLRWCERAGVDYLIGLPKNARLVDEATQEKLELLDQARREAGLSRLRHYERRVYQARSWPCARHVIVKLEVNALGMNPRFVVTTLKGDAETVYQRYCARGDMENRIKEQQLGLFADRTSCTWWWPNQLRLCLSSLAYLLLHAIRRIGLAGTALANAQATTLRLKLLKIGAVVVKNTRRIRFLMASGYPWQSTWLLAARRLAQG